MIKVCHVTSAHPKEDVRIFHKECVSLSKAGYDVSLVQQGDSYEKDGVHIVGFGQIASSRIKRMLFTAKTAYKAALSVDAEIYHLHDPELLPYALKLKKKGKKVIFDSHEKYTDLMQDKPYLPGWSVKVVSTVYGSYERHILRHIDGLIFPCLKKGKHPFEGQCRNITTIDNFPLKSELYDRYDPSVEKYNRSVCYIGSLSHNRGITHAVKAAAKANCTIYLGGLFSPQSYQNELEQLPEYGFVSYLGQLNREQVLDTIGHCNVGIATILNVGQYNQFDNLATKAYEYMSLGVPVLLTRSKYNQAIMEKYQFGICVDPENVDEIATTINYLLEHPEEVRQMGENGRLAIQNEFNWHNEEKKLLAFYREVMEQGV